MFVKIFVYGEHILQTAIHPIKVNDSVFTALLGLIHGAISPVQESGQCVVHVEGCQADNGGDATDVGRLLKPASVE